MSTLVLTALAACAGDAAGPGTTDVPDRNVFVATYVDLRVAALGSEDGELTEEMRTAVLSSHGVTESQLHAFVEAHGQDLPFMRDVWNEVEVLLEERRAPATDPR